jgi:hypothetical protein
MWGRSNGFAQAGLFEGEGEGRELAREKGDDLGYFWGREEDGVDAVDYTVGSELSYH